MKRLALFICNLLNHPLKLNQTLHEYQYKVCRHFTFSRLSPQWVYRLCLDFSFIYCTYASLNTGFIKFIKLIIVWNISNLFVSGLMWMESWRLPRPYRSEAWRRSRPAVLRSRPAVRRSNPPGSSSNLYTPFRPTALKGRVLFRFEGLVQYRGTKPLLVSDQTK